MPNIGPLELIVVLIIALVVFGPKRLPELGRSLGRGIREFRGSVSGDNKDDDDDDEEIRELERSRERGEGRDGRGPRGRGSHREAKLSRRSMARVKAVGHEDRLTPRRASRRASHPDHHLHRGARRRDVALLLAERAPCSTSPTARCPRTSGRRADHARAGGGVHDDADGLRAYFAILLALPVILYQAYAYVLPAFSRDGAAGDPAAAPPGAGASSSAGVVFAYFVVMPPAIDFLAQLQRRVVQQPAAGARVLHVLRHDADRAGADLRDPAGDPRRHAGSASSPPTSSPPTAATRSW